MVSEFWIGFVVGAAAGIAVCKILFTITPAVSDYKYDEPRNWHPDYREPKRTPRVLKKTGKK